MKNLKIQNKKRFVCFLSIIGLMFALCAGLLPHALADGNTKDIIVVVEPGDTLWELCEANRPRGKDVRGYVEKVKYYNHKTSSGVTVGESIRLPQ